jgi:hydroxymethylpyrimidine/phosphomethylpyrimidine kinase
VKGHALSVAGLDPSGGAGLYQDLRVFSALGVRGQGVPTVLTVQNLQGVGRTEPLSPDLFSAMLEAVVREGAPRAVKIGLMDASLVGVVSDFLEGLPGDVVRILDPVFLFGTGGSVLTPPAYRDLARSLFSRVDLVTPNLPEALELGGEIPGSRPEDLVMMARRLHDQYGVRGVLLKGGHRAGEEPRTDLFWTPSGERFFSHPFRRLPGIHGGGCTLSSLVAALLVRGESSLAEAVARALELYQTLLSRVSGEGRAVLDPDVLRPLFSSP